MAAPNLVNVSSILGKTTGITLTTSNQDVVTCAADKVLKINSFIVSNIDGTNSADVTVFFQDSSQSSANFSLATTVAVPADSTLVVIGKDSPIYLEESDKLIAVASANSDLVVVCSYEELDDA